MLRRGRRAAAVLVILGGAFLGGGWQAAREGRAGADTLVSLGALGAYGYSVYAVAIGAEAVYFDTVTMVLVIFTLGRYLEALGRARALRSLAPLLAAEEAKASVRSEEHTSELQSLMRISYAVFCLKKKKTEQTKNQ